MCWLVRSSCAYLRKRWSVYRRKFEQVRLRSDTAGYQHDLLKYCDSGEDQRFSRIEFAVGCPVTKEFKRVDGEVCEDDWQPMHAEKDGKTIVTRRQWTEVCLVPDELARSKTGRHYRYLATREIIDEQHSLPGMQDEKQYPFQTITTKGRKYKVFGIVTNRDMNGNDLINRLYERCGESEEVHRAIKDDFAGGKLPSGGFGQNEAWWWIMVLALNLNAVMKRLVLGGRLGQAQDESAAFCVDSHCRPNHHAQSAAYYPLWSLGGL